LNAKWIAWASDIKSKNLKIGMAVQEYSTGNCGVIIRFHGEDSVAVRFKTGIQKLDRDDFRLSLSNTMFEEIQRFFMKKPSPTDLRASSELPLVKKQRI
jgi:hypothetical protein